MKRKCADQGPDLFTWADEQPLDCPSVQDSEAAPVVDFLTKRDTLPRRILNPPPPFLYLDRRIARKAGDMPPAPILAFTRRNRRPEPGSDGDHVGRTGT